MSGSVFRGIVAAAAITVISCLTPSSSRACGFGFGNGSSGSSSPTTFAPPYSAQRVTYLPVANPSNLCAAPAVNYVPQVRYRWTFKRVQRTSYRPVASCDPCTGSPTTVFRPVTTKSLLPWFRREAYTTYQPVPVASFAPLTYNPSATTCNPCATTCDSCGGTAIGGLAGSSGCSSCAGGSSSTIITDPGYSTGSGRTFAPTPDSGTTYPGPSSGAQPDVRLKPKPDAETSQPHADQTPRLISPTGRTAMLPVRPVIHYEPITVPAGFHRSSPARRIDTGGWRAAAD